MLLDELFENDQDHQNQLEKTGFWGKQGAGCLFLATSTGRICFSLRSLMVLEPHTWGTWGGAIDEGETPEQAVHREVEEETFTTIDILHTIPLYVFTSGTFKYHNFLVVVDDEFTPNIDDPRNWETEGYKWVEFGEWPSPLHPGAAALLKDSNSMTTIQNIISK